MTQTAAYRATTRIKAKAIKVLDLAPYTLGDRQTAELRETILDRPVSSTGTTNRVYALVHNL